MSSLDYLSRVVPKRVKVGGDRLTMGHVNLAALCTLQHGVWAASQYLNSIKSNLRVLVLNWYQFIETIF